MFGVATGVTGTLGTVAFDIHAGGGTTGEAMTMAIIDDVNQRNAHVGIIFGFATVAQLLILAAAWRVAVERERPESIAARVVSGGVTAAAGALSLGYGWKGAMATYHSDGNEANAYDQIGRYVYYLLNDFGSWIDRVSVSVAAGAFAWMGLDKRSIPLWIGIFNFVPIILAWGMMIATGRPGQSAISTIWMIVAFAGLAIHKDAIRETSPDGVVAGHTAPEIGVRRERVAPAQGTAHPGQTRTAAAMDAAAVPLGRMRACAHRLATGRSTLAGGGPDPVCDRIERGRSARPSSVAGQHLLAQALTCW